MSDHVTVSEAARLLEVSADTIRRWDATGRLPAQRTRSGLRLFRREDIERFAEQRSGRPAVNITPPDWRRVLDLVDTLPTDDAAPDGRRLLLLLRHYAQARVAGASMCRCADCLAGLITELEALERELGGADGKTPR